MDYRISDRVGLIVLNPNERARYPRPWYIAVSEAISKAGFRLLIHHSFRFVLRSYGLVSTQLKPELVEPNGRIMDVMERSLLRGGDGLLYFPNPLHFPRNLGAINDEMLLFDFMGLILYLWLIHRVQ